MDDETFAKQIVAEVLAEAEQLGSRTVDQVDVSVGELEGITRIQLVAAFERAARDTLLEGVPLRVEVRRVRARCGRCGKARPLPMSLRRSAPEEAVVAPCYACGGALTISGGRGLAVTRAVMYPDETLAQRRSGSPRAGHSSSH